MLVSQCVMQARMRTDLRVDFFYINQIKFFFELSFQIKMQKRKNYSHKLWFLFNSPSSPVTIETQNKDYNDQ